MKISRTLKSCLILSIIAVASLLPVKGVLAQDTSLEPKQVLAIFIFKQGMPWPYYIEQSMRAALGAATISNIEFHVEYADQTRFPEKQYRSRVMDMFQYKYSKREMDLILVFGGEAVELMAEYGDMQSTGAPVLLITTDQKSLAQSHLKANMRSMTWGLDFAATASLVQELLPKTRNLFVISGTSQMDQKLKKLAVETLAEFDDRFTIHYIDDLAVQELLSKVAQLPENSAIFFISLFRDANGKAHVPRDIMSEVSKKANAPVFGMIDTYMGYGIVGGSLLSAEFQGRKYADIAKKITQGGDLADSNLLENANQIIVDWRQLKRWSIDEDRLPAGSIVRYRESTMWEDHKWQIVAVIVVILGQAFALFALQIQHGRRRRAEEEAQKLRDERAHISRVMAMGEIAASLAHELNQPLSAIRSYAQAAQRFLDNEPSQPDEAGRALAGIVAGNRRAEEVIKRIRNALKKETFKRTCLDVTETIDEVIKLVQKKAGEHDVMLGLEIETDLPWIFGDRVQLQQVLFNLIINAIEAIADDEGKAGEVKVTASREGANAVLISVRDNGVGVRGEQQELLFDAFYTTKAEGMGIGLSISRSIIEDHGGVLSFSSKQDKGTTFSFTVPIYEEQKNDLA